MNVRYRVDLSQAERDELTALLSGGKHPVRKLKRAQILLAADGGIGDDEIAATVVVGGSTVYRTKRRFVEGNLEAALSEDPRPGAERKLSGSEEALLVATACSRPPAGCARWTLELLADELVTLTEHTSLSRETVRRRLVENDLKPWRKAMWCIPKVDAEYVARMEDVLDLYAETPDPKRPGTQEVSDNIGGVTKAAAETGGRCEWRAVRNPVIGARDLWTEGYRERLSSESARGLAACRTDFYVARHRKIGVRKVLRPSG